MKIVVLLLQFHWSLWIEVFLTVSIGSDNSLVLNRQQVIIWTNDDLVYWNIYVSFWKRLYNFVARAVPADDLASLGTKSHDDVIKWKLFLRYWPFVQGIHQSPVNSPHKGQWRGALMFSLICAWISNWVNNGEAGDLRRYRTHYDVTVMICMDSDDHWPVSI